MAHPAIPDRRYVTWGFNGRTIVAMRDAETDYVVDDDLTEQQAQRWVAGQLDYCSGCRRLVQPFDARYCDACEVSE